MEAALQLPHQLNDGYVEEMFELYSQDPRLVGPEWRAYFSGFLEGYTAADTSQANSPRAMVPSSATSPTAGVPELWAYRLQEALKDHGHRFAQVNPVALGITPVPTWGDLGVDLPPALADTTVVEAPALWGWGPCTLGAYFEKLRALLCGSVGFEFGHVLNPKARQWLWQKAPQVFGPVAPDLCRHFFQELAKTDALEKTIATKFIGKKRFSIEGADAQFVALESYLDKAVALGAREAVVGMAHRGRLNLLVHAIGKPLEQLFAEFEGYPSPHITGDGDVKYHEGYESQRTTRSGHSLSISMSRNPSHLEFVDPVALGECRAKQDRYHNGNRGAVWPILLHGDAAFAGQGVVYETLQMHGLAGYHVGGTLHIIANNQVGFTTNPVDSRSSPYCSDVAKCIGAPVFHVNSEDIHSLHHVMELAAEYRAQFGEDVVIDLLCYRRHGHNEADEPTFTQPLLYKLIKEKAPPYEVYLNRLKEQMPEMAAREVELKDYYASQRASMNAVYDGVKANHTPITPPPRPRGLADLTVGLEGDMLKPTATGVGAEVLKTLGAPFCQVPEGFQPNPKLARIILQDRAEMLAGTKPLDWGFCELLAYASLVEQGYRVRLSGQDARRGTFSHRHGVLVDVETAAHYHPLGQLAAAKGTGAEIFDTLLSETAAMGFEYGYASAHEKALVVWEGQFGDFANGAQVIIDQFLVAGESKWQQSQGLVLLLPHGFEGQGPEHSSGRMERFLQLTAQGNIQVGCFTTGAQLFHALRRQVLRPFRKPLVVMSPKSFLRNPRVASTFEDLSQGSFEEVLADPRPLATVERVVLCTGKLSLDLLDAAGQTPGGDTTAIVRLEQLYPLHIEKIQGILNRHPKAHLVWAQEEPKNMGAWWFLCQHLVPHLKGRPVVYVGRSNRASPAVGLEKSHMKEQSALIEAAFTSLKDVEI